MIMHCVKYELLDGLYSGVVNFKIHWKQMILNILLSLRIHCFGNFRNIKNNICNLSRTWWFHMLCFVTRAISSKESVTCMNLHFLYLSHSQVLLTMSYSKPKVVGRG